MLRISMVLTSALGLTLISGCQRDGDVQLSEKFDQIIEQEKKQTALLEQIAAKPSAPVGAAAGRGAAPSRGEPRKRPEPGKVYSVPADGAYQGVKDAKVTVVEAFEFA